MSLKIDYVARETAGNLFRNFTITLASVVTVAVSLALVGAGRHLVLPEPDALAARGPVGRDVLLERRVVGRDSDDRERPVGHRAMAKAAGVESNADP